MLREAITHHYIGVPRRARIIRALSAFKRDCPERTELAAEEALVEELANAYWVSSASTGSRPATGQPGRLL